MGLSNSVKFHGILQARILEWGAMLENDGDFRLPLGLALGSPIFPWSWEGKLGVLLESLQGPQQRLPAPALP